MFIELTDHLRCPAAHAEQFLVLVPDVIEARSVQRGVLGCPVCDAEYRIEDGVVQFDTAIAGIDAPAPLALPSALTADAVRALLGIEGPGGYVVFVGDPGRLAAEDEAAYAGIGAVLINAPGTIVGSGPRVSLLRASRIPLKARSVRGVVLGAPYGEQPDWIAEAQRVLLPGRHLVGQGAVPSAPGLTLLASADGWWVGV